MKFKVTLAQPESIRVIRNYVEPDASTPFAFGSNNAVFAYGGVGRQFAYGGTGREFRFGNMRREFRFANAA